LLNEKSPTSLSVTVYSCSRPDENEVGW